MVKSWAQGLEEWWLWLLGDSSMPGKRSRVILATTVVVVVVLAVGLVLAFRGPARTVSAKSNGNGSQSDQVNSSMGLPYVSDGASGSTDNSSNGSNSSGNSGNSGNSG